jgi:hypothetical protein
MACADGDEETVYSGMFRAEGSFELKMFELKDASS